MVKKDVKRFRTVALSSTKQNKEILNIAEQCQEVLTNLGLKVLFDSNVAKLKSKGTKHYSKKHLIKHSDLLIAIGGDGTMLNCAREYGSHGIPILGINLGSLGFLNDIPPKELSDNLTKVVEGNFVLDKRFFLDIVVARFAKKNHMNSIFNCIAITQ